ncbi:MAG: RND family efflux transporter MFP subunit [Pseudoalteromonas rhizosphaerae]|mgnify:CR=1 FL=1|jgi:RND family efflux transporter MFP subunit|uniref:Efflux RND transporter periplasmic adaptor subunit n=1 Tax=Pseudoalteromonas neustonica TaxID=1840331 RepID=A0ABY3FDV3_9GAMM|nr:MULTISPECIES: efflux RND transporter periplasmic adaptor subunit [Pseudoalteromonas]MBB1303414.1 efflux RND transporter periplasmic adaptor subunit [Pseudoalteromonas sp. SR44-8]MBB1310044.1 efflux RND transporter periplasmic adaptor subunit [Pseudoalteromonas sp. SR41-8]MBB1396870.1 efflux RND transporter periplasmic adaptor subunit [Pseudoalteromonas sp. SG44-8]MBB1409666.1 efflux RND transporter periplasmic adaptor subunit [Pseudoalteromonas sp. SG44-17]TVU83537.1 efflux RND transporter |tara:strand:- start:15771 stop:17072 length:1302 start_codon:yes stop_codon:yes gene_type:complete
MNIKQTKIIIPAAIIAATALLVMFISSNPPEAKRFGSPPKAQISVAVQTLQLQPYQVMVDSFGTVKPRTQSILVAQASGQIIASSEQFREGGFFEKGDVLLQLDDRDHRAEVKEAQANLLTAQQGFQEEQARSRQAIIDWQRLGNGEQASNLVLREPQLAAAQAQVLSAQAKLEKANLNLERTKITAPYAGRVLSRSVDLGQVVSNNTQLATIYAIDSVEIRLPIKNKDLPFIDLPEQFRDGMKNANGSTVEFSSDLVGMQKWQGQVARTEGAIDENAQQLYVVAQINDPYKATAQNQYPIKIGQYIKAQISGKLVADVLVIPNSAIYQGTYVYIVDQGVLQRKNIRLAWQNATQAIIADGLNMGDKLVLTPLGQVSSGTAVKVIGEADKEGSQPTGKRPSREQLAAMAKKQGITVEELMQKRKAARSQGDKP